MERIKTKEHKIDKLRYEKKFIIPKGYESYILSLIMSNYDKLSETYEQRQVNSIYYDSYNFKFAQQNLDGDNKRHKIRLRYYGDIKSIQNPKIEIKSKIGSIGSKKIINLKENYSWVENNINLNKLISIKNISELVSGININIFELKPTLFVSYLRKYFISNCNQFRLTLDKKISFKSIEFPLNPNSIDFEGLIKAQESILEIKYNVVNEPNNFLNNLRFPFRISRYSKYINGLKYTGILKI